MTQLLYVKFQLWPLKFYVWPLSFTPLEISTSVTQIINFTNIISILVKLILFVTDVDTSTGVKLNGHTQNFNGQCWNFT